jgi:hypothetical protein
MFNLRIVFGGLALAFAAISGASAANATDDKSVNRYPFDPACAWGRLADGRGMVIRCLTEAEATQLAATKPSVPSAAPAGVSAETTERKPVVEAATGPVEADVVSVSADEGNLPIARRKLRTPREKYARCVSDNGGLAADVGEVTVRFLVRELGRAEGTSVEKRQGMSEAAAKCIAAVVDRRPVGTPEGPMVGATAVIRVTKQIKRSGGSTPGR